MNIEDGLRNYQSDPDGQGEEVSQSSDLDDTDGRIFAPSIEQSYHDSRLPSSRSEVLTQSNAESEMTQTGKQTLDEDDVTSEAHKSMTVIPEQDSELQESTKDYIHLQPDAPEQPGLSSSKFGQDSHQLQFGSLDSLTFDAEKQQVQQKQLPPFRTTGN